MNELMTQQPAAQIALTTGSMLSNVALMESLHRFAVLMSESRVTVPTHLHGNVPDCMAVAMQSAQQARLEDALREHAADIRMNADDWQRLQARLRRYDDSLLPQSRARIEAALVAYGAGTGLLKDVLDARRMALELAKICQQAGVPLMLANARMSDKSAHQARRLAWLSRPAFKGLTAVWAQTQADAVALTGLGAPVRGVFGNLKFDAEPNPTQHAVGQIWRAQAARPVVMLASSREGEEAALLDVLESFRALAPVDTAQSATESIVNSIQWLIVPRHPQRFDEVNALLAKAALLCERRSAWGDREPDAARMTSADVVLGDSLGEMQTYYLVSRMALLGGSFAPLGGQNLIEAAACACPVVMGPHTFNFADAAALAVAQGAAWQMQDMQAALDQVVLALTHPQSLEHAQKAAVQLLEKGRGAVSNHIQALRSTAVIKMNGSVA